MKKDNTMKNDTPSTDKSKKEGEEGSSEDKKIESKTKPRRTKEEIERDRQLKE